MSFDERLRDDVRAEAESVVPDVEQSLRSVRRRTDLGPGTTSWMLATAAALVIVGVLILGVLPRSGPDRGSVPSPTGGRPTPAGSSLVEALRGTAWTATLGPAGVTDTGTDVAGTWLLRLGERSVIELVPPAGFARSSGMTTLTGVYGIDQGHLVTNAFARDFGPSCAGAGSYQADLVDGRLTLSGTDTCRIRRVILVTTPWTRAEP